jgi:hypothetical protein
MILYRRATHRCTVGVFCVRCTKVEVWIESKATEGEKSTFILRDLRTCRTPCTIPSSPISYS